MLELRGVSREVGGVKHLSDVSIRLERGELNILLGQAQSGKTSLLRVMAGLEKPGSGEVWFDGKLVRKDGIFVPKTLHKLNPEYLLGA